MSCGWSSFRAVRINLRRPLDRILTHGWLAHPLQQIMLPTRPYVMDVIDRFAASAGVRICYSLLQLKFLARHEVAPSAGNYGGNHGKSCSTKCTEQEAGPAFRWRSWKQSAER